MTAPGLRRCHSRFDHQEAFTSSGDHAFGAVEIRHLGLLGGMRLEGIVPIGINLGAKYIPSGQNIFSCLFLLNYFKSLSANSAQFFICVYAARQYSQTRYEGDQPL